jgi:hypothetical protein
MPVRILPLFGLEASLHIDVRSFGKVFSCDLCQLPKEDNVVPLCSFLLLTVLLVRNGSSKAKGTNGASILQKLLFRMASVVTISAIDLLFSYH